MKEIGEQQTTRPAPCKACALARRRGDNFCPECGRQVKKGTPAPAGRGDTPSEELPDASDKVLPCESQPSPDQKTPHGESPRTPPAHEHALHCACGQTPPPGASFCCGCGRPVGETTPHYVLECRATDGSGTRVVLKGGEAIIGKTDDCDLKLSADGYISRRHARVYETDDGVFVEDLGSANGTFVRVRRPMRLEPGDEIVAGTTVILLNAATS